MAFQHGKSTVFKIDDSASVLRDLSAFLTSVSGLPGSGDIVETTTFGVAGDARTYIRGLNGATFDIEGGYDSTATTGPDAVLSGLRTNASTSTFEYGPEGGTAGKVRYTGECLMTEYSAESEVDGWTTFTASFTMTGALTRNTF